MKINFLLWKSVSAGGVIFDQHEQFWVRASIDQMMTEKERTRALPKDELH